MFCEAALIENKYHSALRNIRPPRLREIFLRVLGITFHELWDELADEYQRLGRSHDVERLAESTLQNHIVSISALSIHLGNLRDHNGVDAAYQFFFRIPKSLIDAPRLKIELASLKLWSGEENIAFDIAKSISDKHPDNSYAFGITILALVKMGKFQELYYSIMQASNSSLDCNWAVDECFKILRRDESKLGIDRDTFKSKLDDMIDRISCASVDYHSRSANLYLLLGDFDGARFHLLQVSDENGSLDQKIASLQAEQMLDSSYWDFGVENIKSVMRRLPANGKEISKFQMLSRFCSELAEFYVNDTDFPHDYKVPDSAFEMIFSTADKLYSPSRENSLALVGATMAAGGAERVLGSTVVGFRDWKFIESHLWLHSVDNYYGNDHFLKEFGIELGLDATELPRVDLVEYPFSVLPLDTAQKAQSLYQMFVKERPAVVHAWQDATNLEVAFAGVLAGVPKIVLHPHNMRPDLVHEIALAPSFRRAYRALLRRKEVELVCVSEASLTDYLEWLKVERNARHHVVYNGFDWPCLCNEHDFKSVRMHWRDVLEIPQDSFVVGGVFRVVKLKRPELWVDCAHRILQAIPHAYFVVIGDGPELSRMKDYCNSLDISHRVLFCGFVSNVQEKLSAFDVLLHTSESEGLPTVILEAQAAGIPVVAVGVGGVPEVMFNKDSILSISSGAKEISNEVVRVFGLTIDQEYRRMLNRFIVEKFGKEQMMHKLVSIYGLSQDAQI